jgi:hypothetical protein
MKRELEVPTIETVAAAIRAADGDHTMGAGALAEVVVAALVPLLSEAWSEGYAAGFHDVGYGDEPNPWIPA